MKRQFFAACGLLFVGACTGVNGSGDGEAAGGFYDANGVWVAYCSGEPAPVIFTKEGFPIIDDQACIPEPEVLGLFVTNPNDEGPAIPAPPSGGTTPPGDGGGTTPPGDGGGTTPPGDGGGTTPPGDGGGTTPPGGSGGNNGWGNGDQDAPGGSQPNNNAENNSGGNNSGNSGNNGNNGNSGNRGGSAGSKGFDQLSIAEQTFLLWNVNNRVDYQAYLQWLLDNDLVVAE